MQFTANAMVRPQSSFIFIEIISSIFAFMTLFIRQLDRVVQTIAWANDRQCRAFSLQLVSCLFLCRRVGGGERQIQGDNNWLGHHLHGTRRLLITSLNTSHTRHLVGHLSLSLYLSLVCVCVYLCVSVSLTKRRSRFRFYFRSRSVHAVACAA